MKFNKQLTLLTAIFLICQTFLLAQTYNWTQINEPYSGTVFNLAVNSADKIYILFNNRIYFTVDKGMNWQEYSDNSIGPNVVYVDDDDNVYIGTSNSGLFYTFNDGQSWEWHYVHHAPHSGLSPYIGAIWSDQSHILLNGFRSNAPFDWFYEYPGEPGFFYHFAELQNGLAIGSDSYAVYLAENAAGTSWSQPANNGLNSDFINDIVADANDNIFLATQNGLFVSDDLAENFELDSELGTQQVNTLYIGNSGNIYAGTEENGIYKSTDDGNSWTQLTELPEQKIYDLVVTSEEEIFASAGTLGIFYSDDGGDSWENRVTGLTTTSPRAIDFDSENHIYVESMTGVYYSDNQGADWEYISQGTTGILGSFGIDHQDNLYIGIYQSFFPNGNGGVYFSSDHGENWELRDDNLQTANILKIEFDDEDKVYLLATDTTSLSVSRSVVFMSDNQGMNWDLIFDSPVDLDSASTFPFNDMEVTSAGDIFIGGSTGPFNAAVVYSHDQGVTWQVFEDEMQGAVDHLEIATDNKIFAIGSFNSYYTSDDNGNSWTINSLSGWPETDDFLIDHAGNFITNGNNQGFNFSGDQGQSWTEINDGIPSSNGYYQFLTTACDLNNNLFTFTYNGFFTTDVTVGVPENSSLINDQLTTELYPNPVPDNFYLKISSDKQQIVEVGILDLAGKLIESRKIEVVEGSQTFSLSANYPGGVYFVTLRTLEGFMGTMKFIKK